MQRSERRGGFSYSVIDWVRPAYIQGMCICTSIMCIYSYLDHGEVTQYNEAAQGFNKFFFFVYSLLACDLGRQGFTSEDVDVDVPKKVWDLTPTYV